MVKIASNKNIKGITVEIGGDVQGLDKALDSVDNKSKDLSSELKQVNKLLKLDPDNVVLLAQKQKILSEQVENSAEKLEKLKSVQDQIERQYASGEIDEGAYRRFQREIEDTALALKMAESQLETAQNSSEGFGKSVKDAGEKTEKSKRQVSNFGQTLKQAFTIGAVVSTIQGLVSSMDSLVESSMELSGDLSKFEQNVKDSGNSLSVMQDELTGLVALTGETDSSIEALSNLMAIGFDDSQMTQAVEALSGAVIKFPDTLKIESLSDSLQETIATGKGVGQFAELIERSGYNLDEFNEQLAKGKTETDRQRIALEWLSESGLATVSDEYKEANKDLLAYKEAAHESALASAEMAEGLTPLATLTEQLKAKFFKSMASELTKLMPKIQSFVSKTNKFIGGFEDDFESISDSVEETLETVGEIGGDLLKEAKPAIKNIVKTVKSSLSVLPSALKLIYNLLKPILWTTIKTTEFASLLSEKLTGFFSQEASELDELKESVDETINSWENYKNTISETLQESNSEIDSIERARDNLSKLVDENGKLVGSESALLVAIENLKENGFDVEYDAIKHQIKGYDELKKKIQETIQLKDYESKIESLKSIKEQNEKDKAVVMTQYDNLRQAIEKENKRLLESFSQVTETPEEYMKSLIAENSPLTARLVGLMESSDALQKQLEEFVLAEDAYEKAIYASTSGDYSEALDVLNTYFDAVEIITEDGKSRIDQTLEELQLSLESSSTTLQGFVKEGNIGLSQLWVDEIGKTVSAIQANGGEIPESILSVLNSSLLQFKSMGGEIPESLANGINANSDAVEDATQNVIDGAEKVDTSGFFIVGKNMGAGIVNGLKAMLPNIVKQASSVVNSAMTAMKKASDEHSPSKKTRQIGAYMGEGLELGLLDRIRDVQNVSARLAKSAIAPIAATTTTSFTVNNTNNFNTTAARDGTALVRQINRELGSLYYKR